MNVRLIRQVALLQALGKGNGIVLFADDEEDGFGECFENMGAVGAVDHGLVILNQGFACKVPAFFDKAFNLPLMIRRPVFSKQAGNSCSQKIISAVLADEFN